MGGSNKHQCKLCGNETYKIYAYPHTVPEVIPFKAYKKTDTEGDYTIVDVNDIDLRICPKCGHVQGEVLENG